MNASLHCCALLEQKCIKTAWHLPIVIVWRNKDKNPSKKTVKMLQKFETKSASFILGTSRLSYNMRFLPFKKLN
jgi:hypothetical protein